MKKIVELLNCFTNRQALLIAEKMSFPRRRESNKRGEPGNMKFSMRLRPLVSKWIPAFAGMTLLLLISYLVLPISHAQDSNALSITPSSADLKIGDEKIISFSVTSPTKISGFDLKFTTSGGLLITDFRDQPSFDNKFDLFAARNVAREINGSNSRIAYILTAASSDLPATVTVYAKVKGTSGGQGKITLDYNNSQVLDGNGRPLNVTPLTATYNLNPNQSSATFFDQAALPPIKYPDSAAVVDLKIKLAGAMINPKISSIKAIAVAVGRIGEGKYETQPQQFNLTPSDNGTFTGQVAFPDFKDGNKFSLMIKVDKYLLRRVCDPAPTEQKLGVYNCTDPKLTIRKGEKNAFDFSKISLLPGDLGLADGVLNGYDLNTVRINLGKNTPEAAGFADLNYDGIVDQKDFDVISQVAGSTNREGDQ